MGNGILAVYCVVSLLKIYIYKEGIKKENWWATLQNSENNIEMYVHRMKSIYHSTYMLLLFIVYGVDENKA